MILESHRCVCVRAQMQTQACKVQYVQLRECVRIAGDTIAYTVLNVLEVTVTIPHEEHKHIHKRCYFYLQSLSQLFSRQQGCRPLWANNLFIVARERAQGQVPNHYT